MSDSASRPLVHRAARPGRRRSLAALSLAGAAAALGMPPAARAQKKYGPGVTDKEIKLGQTMPYSGPASAFGSAGRVQLAYFKMINAQGGVNGRQISMVSLDDGFSPPKAVEMARKLVEEENVLAIMGSVGTPTNVTIARYLNAKQVPHLVIASGSSKLDDPVGLPWSAPFYASQLMEGQLYAEYLLKARPDAKIAILYQNDDYGKGNIESFKRGLGAKAATMIVKEATYELSDPTVDNQVIALKASGADVFFHATSSKFAAQAIRKSHELGWKPLQIIISNVSSIGGTLRPAGLDASTGVVTSMWAKVPGDPAWAGDKAMQDYLAFVKQWAPNENPEDSVGSFGYIQAMMMVEILKRCGDDLSRENLLKQALGISDLQLPLMIPGVKINTSPNARVAWRQSKLARFDGTNWVLFGDVLTMSDPK